MLIQLLWLPLVYAEATSACRMKNGAELKFDPAYEYCDIDLGVVKNSLKVCVFGGGRKFTYQPDNEYCESDLGVVKNSLKVCVFGNSRKVTYQPENDFCDSDLGVVRNSLKVCEFGTKRKQTYQHEIENCDSEFGVVPQHHKFCKISDGRGAPFDTRSYKCFANYGVIPITHQLCDRGTIYPFNPDIEKCEGRLIEAADAEKDPKEKRCGNYDKSVNNCDPEYGVYPKGYQLCRTRIGSVPYNPDSRKCVEGFIMNHDQSLCKSADGKNLNYYTPSSQSCCDGEVKAGLDSCFVKPESDKFYCPRVATGEPLGFRNALVREAEERTRKMAEKIVGNVLQPGDSTSQFTGSTGRAIKKLWHSPITDYFKNVYDSLETQMAVMGVLRSGRTNMITAVESIRGTYHASSLQTLNSSTASILFSRSVPEYSAMIGAGNLCVAPSASNSHQFEFHFYNVSQQQCKRMMQLLPGLDMRVIINNKYGSSRDCIEDKEALYRDDIPRNYLNFVFSK